MKILGIESALDIPEVAMFDQEKQAFPSSLTNGAPFSENVLKLTRRVLSACEADRTTLGAIAVSIGPGSFTGLRIGLSVAKGLAISLELPLVSVSTLDVLAGSVIYGGTVADGAEFLALIDAKRGDYYCTSYKNHQGSVRRLSEPHVCRESEIFGIAPQESKVIVVGNDVRKLEQHLRESYGKASSKFHLVGKSSKVSPAAAVAILGLQKLRRVEVSDPESLEPSYLKDFVIQQQG